jgi:hypothetical protein
MTPEMLADLFEAVSKSRADGPIIDALISTIHERGWTLSLEDLGAILNRLHLPGPDVLPALLTDFLCGYFAGSKVRSILDPFTLFGSLIIPLAKATGAETAYALSYPAGVALAKAVDGAERVSWLTEPGALDRLEGPFDAVVSALTFDVDLQTRSFPTDNGSVEVCDYSAYVLLLEGARKLADAGAAWFVIAPSFVAPSRLRSTFSSLTRLGLALQAYIAVPSGLLTSPTTRSLGLVLLDRRPQQELFVGELRGNPEHNRTVMENLKARRQADELAAGWLLPLERFRGYRALEAAERVQRTAWRLGFARVPFAEAVSEIHRTQATSPPGFKDRPNAVYLPLIGRSKAHASLAALTLKPHNYLQLIINPNRVVPEYLAGLFNTPFGHTLRQAAESDTFIPKITKCQR